MVVFYSCPNEVREQEIIVLWLLLKKIDNKEIAK